ncbi:uncharacterized protein N7477_001431 [Penicillium maclennaniae]|uniref:uncharacterized protein n=1 Tax=Penicillium maclennaniae TaxID=1343394 RepID=UPI00253FC041|nr:uncharacterized protein N7477_001431 [Penicillium maclennaniae]KAJ5681491.1 hypothetical protein N7477_001431 [Penicillium maclennaniae]
MFTPLRSGSLSVKVPDSIHIEDVHDESTHYSASVQTSESVQDLGASKEIYNVDIVENEPGSDRRLSFQGVSVYDSSSVQEVGSTGHPPPFYNSGYSQYPLAVQIVRVPQHVQEDEDANPSHIFPQLSLALKPESPSSASMLTSQLPGISVGHSSIEDPLARLEKGQITESNVTSGPARLGSIDVKKMTSATILFVFGILGVMANLRPCFTYKYGLDGKIGVRLQIYGHTVVVEPVSEDVNAVRVIACRRCLEKLRKFHSGWILPPQPMDGPSGPEWSWIQILQDYCQAQGFQEPEYVEGLLGTQYFCDVIVRGQVFRSARQCITLGEARNTVAHIAVHQLLIAEVTSGPESPDPPMHLSDVKPFTEPIANEDLPLSLVQDFTNSLEDDLQRLMMNCTCQNRLPTAQAQAPDTLSPVQLQKVMKRGPRRRRWKKNKSSLIKQPKKRSQKKAKQTSSSPMQQATTTGRIPKPSPVPPRPNSNLIPLLKNRLPQLPQEEEKAEDKLSLLKTVETALRKLHATASYWRLLERKY